MHRRMIQSRTERIMRARQNSAAMAKRNGIAFVAQGSAAATSPVNAGATTRRNRQDQLQEALKTTVGKTNAQNAPTRAKTDAVTTREHQLAPKSNQTGVAQVGNAAMTTGKHKSAPKSSNQTGVAQVGNAEMVTGKHKSAPKSNQTGVARTGIAAGGKVKGKTNATTATPTATGSTTIQVRGEKVAMVMKNKTTVNSPAATAAATQAHARQAKVAMVMKNKTTVNAPAATAAATQAHARQAKVKAAMQKQANGVSVPRKVPNHNNSVINPLPRAVETPAKSYVTTNSTPPSTMLEKVLRAFQSNGRHKHSTISTKNTVSPS